MWKHGGAGNRLMKQLCCSEDLRISARQLQMFIDESPEQIQFKATCGSIIAVILLEYHMACKSLQVHEIIGYNYHKVQRNLRIGLCASSEGDMPKAGKVPNEY